MDSNNYISRDNFQILFMFGAYNKSSLMRKIRRIYISFEKNVKIRGSLSIKLLLAIIFDTETRYTFYLSLLSEILC